jgi:TolA-binding protein
MERRNLVIGTVVLSAALGLAACSSTPTDSGQQSGNQRTHTVNTNGTAGAQGKNQNQQNQNQQNQNQNQNQNQQK